jgi:polysaccharide export outer membrane protein
MKDPHVSVFVHEMQSHPVLVLGAVKKPGVLQIRGAKTLLAMLSMAEGLADDAGDTVLVMRGASSGAIPRQDDGIARARQADSPPSTESDRPPADSFSPPQDPTTTEINLKNLLESGGSRDNLAIYPGDVINVTRTGIVYVVGEVKKPGGFVLKSNEELSVMQALALAEGLTRTSAKGQARIIHTDEKTGERTETPVDLGKVLAGKIADPRLRPKDIFFVPNSASRSALSRALDATLQTASGVLIFRR